MYINLSITSEKYVGHMGTYRFIIGHFEILLSLRSSQFMVQHSVTRWTPIFLQTPENTRMLILQVSF